MSTAQQVKVGNLYTVLRDFEETRPSSDGLTYFHEGRTCLVGQMILILRISPANQKVYEGSTQYTYENVTTKTVGMFLSESSIMYYMNNQELSFLKLVGECDQ